MESSQMILMCVAISGFCGFCGFCGIVLTSYLFYREKKQDQLNKNVPALIDSVNGLNNNMKQLIVPQSKVSDKNVCLEESNDEDFSNHWLFQEPKTIKRNVVTDDSDDIIIEM